MVYISPKKRAVPQETRRAVARRHGAFSNGTWPAKCAYCGDDRGSILVAGAWVRFPRLELDHVIPEAKGGQGVPENIVLACRWCNRSKRHWRAPRL